MEFSERLKIVMDYYELSPSNLADQLEVQRSSISHLLSGRNNPSLDFVMKVLNTFPEVELNWFVNGTGKFPVNEKKHLENANTQISAQEKLDQQKLEFPSETNFILPPTQETTPRFNFKKDEIDQIVIFYKDGVFKTYAPKD